MIPQIKEIEGKFPKYATLSSATVSLNDMGDRTISAQVKIDGDQKPDFSYDWEVEFQGERYIHPLREPQASKGNESLCSTIDLVFQHKTIYELKRYYFVEMTSDESGTAIADKYIASLRLDLDKFCVAFQNVLDHYFKGENRIIIDLNPEWVSDKEPSFMEISYSHIWDVLLNIYEVYGVRWVIEGNTIKLGYDTEEVAHLFEYGFEGGLLKVERQVQSEELANSLLGRGGDKNLPYRYFKDVDKKNPSFKADPDWIPELAKISFGNLRGKTFRDYIKGWKAQRYGGEPMTEPTEEYLRGYADSERSTEEESFFDPIEYVEDKDSIDKYDLLQGSLDNVEDIFPTIQGVEVEGLGRVDEVVGVEKVLVDEDEQGSIVEIPTQDISKTSGEITSYISNGQQVVEIKSDTFTIENGVVGHFIASPNVEALCRCYYTRTHYYRNGGSRTDRGWYSAKGIGCTLLEYHLFDASTQEEIQDIANVPNDIKLYAVYRVSYKDYPKGYNDVEYDGISGTWSGSSLEYDDKCYVTINITQSIDESQINGIVLGNYKEGNIRISGTTTIKKDESSTVILESDSFEIDENGATFVDIPINIITDESAKGLYEWKKNVECVNIETNEVVSAVNIPNGKYYLRVSVEIRNLSSQSQQYKVELMPSYIYYPSDVEGYKPTFAIWIKNIWGTTRDAGESETAYRDRVWTPILGNRGDEAKVCFSTGWLSSHSDYEFAIKEVNYAGGSGVEYGGVPAEWKLTLIKSDAELEATGKWIPSASTNGQAYAGDKFFFIGIDMPHQYVLWAEERLDQYKREQLKDTAHIKPTWVVQTDKVRLNEERNGQRLIDSFKVGNTIRLADTRFIEGEERLYLQSVTYTWDAQTVMLPNVEVVLSDKVATSSNPVSLLQGEVDALSKQVGSISNIQQIVRAVGDRLYLRKDGFADNSNSETTFNKQINSRDYRQGAVAGQGWALRAEQGKGIIECDKLVVRDEMQVNSLVANQVSAIGGKEILSAASIKCIKVDILDKGFKCYFDQKRGSVTNHFIVDDIAYSQVFDPHNIQVKYYKRVVTEVGDNYIVLSTQSTGDGTPQEGDVIVQYGNMDTDNHPERQFVIIRDVIGGGYERMLCGLNDIDSEGIEYFFAGRLEGGTPRWFVGHPDGEHAEWKDGKLRIKGVLEVGSDVGGATVVEGGLVTAETIALGEEGSIKAGITGQGSSDSDIRIWAGDTEENKGDAPFRVQQDGKMIAKNAEIEGKIKATEGEFKGSIRSPFGKNLTGDTVNTVDNFTLMSMFSPFYLPCNDAQSGRKLTLVGSGELKLDAPESTQVINFYDQGVPLKSISLNSEIIELIGYSSEGAFMGWIVLNRRPYTRSNPQGRTMNPIIFGRAKYRNSTLTQECYTCEGTQLPIKRLSTGTYELNIPSSLASDMESLIVNCTTTATNEFGDYPVSVVAFKYTTKATIEFRMYNANGNRMDGAFDFIIYPITAWT
jgi:hypothetical protein